MDPRRGLETDALVQTRRRKEQLLERFLQCLDFKGSSIFCYFMVMLSTDLRAVGKGLTHLRNSDEAERHLLSVIPPKKLLYWFAFVTWSKLKSEDLIDPGSQFSAQRMPREFCSWRARGFWPQWAFRLLSGQHRTFPFQSDSNGTPAWGNEKEQGQGESWLPWSLQGTQNTDTSFLFPPARLLTYLLLQQGFEKLTKLSWHISPT